MGLETILRLALLTRPACTWLHTRISKQCHIAWLCFDDRSLAHTAKRNAHRLRTHWSSSVDLVLHDAARLRRPVPTTFIHHRPLNTHHHPQCPHKPSYPNSSCMQDARTLGVTRELTRQARKGSSAGNFEKLSVALGCAARASTLAGLHSLHSHYTFTVFI